MENVHVPLSLIVPGLPHPLLCADACESYTRLRKGFEDARVLIDHLTNPDRGKRAADLLLIYSTQWPSVLGHQIQGAARLTWTHVDPEFHELGSIPYDFAFDSDFAHAHARAAEARGLHARVVEYRGFPIDTGTIVARKLLDPAGRLPCVVVSCNMYADRAETLVLGKAALDALRTTGRKAVVVAVTGLSMRMLPNMFPPAQAQAQERISLARDDEWNTKILELLAAGRLEDVSQLARSFHREARADQKFKALWWLSAVHGGHNQYDGNVLAYASLQGTGAAVVALREASGDAGKGGDQEFDEDDVEFFRGERSVLVRGQAHGPAGVGEEGGGNSKE